ncbi:MAG: cohesin domain-containing protein [Ignavibacteriales bacterium]|nr:cohesin domain-containing protein [Ignavibacteriales bacterium]
MKKILRKSRFVCLPVVSLLLVLSCEKAVTPPESVPTNPLDIPGLPVTTITQGPAQGSVLATSSATFRWSGNSEVGAFSCRLNGGTWSFWSTRTDTTIDDIDDGSCLFEVKSRHKNNITEEQNFPTRSFSVDAIQGPAAIFYPRRKAVTVSQSFTYDIRAEDVSGLLGCKLAMTYDPAIIKIDTIVAGDLVKKNGGFAESYLTRDPSGVKVVFEAVILGGTPKGVTGSGALATLTCRVVGAQQANLVFVQTETLYRDTGNKPLTIRQLVGGKVVAK